MQSRCVFGGSDEEKNRDDELEPRHVAPHCDCASEQDGPVSQLFTPPIVTQQNPAEVNDEEKEPEREVAELDPKHFTAHCCTVSTQSPLSQELIPRIVTQQKPLEENEYEEKELLGVLEEKLEDEGLEEEQEEELETEDDDDEKLGLEECGMQSAFVAHWFGPGPFAVWHV